MTGRPPRWSPAVVVLHWVNAALILALLALGWAMTHRVFGAATTFDLYQQHKSLGFVGARADPAPPGRAAALPAPAAAHAGLDGRLARAVQAAFYVLTLAAIGAGWLVVSASPLPVPTRLFGLFVMPEHRCARRRAVRLGLLAHRLAAYAIAALVALHVAGALKHRWIDRDDTLGRMAPRRRTTD